MARELDRREDWARAQVRLGIHLKFLAFYSTIILVGIVFSVTGIVCLAISREGWGHSLAILIGGLFLVLLSPIGYRGDTWGIRDDDKG